MLLGGAAPRAAYIIIITTVYSPPPARYRRASRCAMARKYSWNCCESLPRSVAARSSIDTRTCASRPAKFPAVHASHSSMLRDNLF
jgi:hypothetical protein